MGFFIALSRRIGVAYRLRKSRLCRLLALGTSVGINSYQLFCASSPTPFSEGRGIIQNLASRKEERTQSPEWVIEFFWLREWDLNLTTFGL